MKQNECKWYQVCPMKYYFEMGKLDKKWITNYCKGDWQSCIRFFKEEHNIYHPDNMLPDGTVDAKL